MRIIKLDFLKTLKAAASALGDIFLDPTICNIRLVKFKDILCVRCSNRHVFAHTTMPIVSVEDEADFDVLIEGKPFIGFLSEIKDDDIELFYKENELSISTPNLNVKFASISTEGFPDFPTLNTTSEVDFDLEKLSSGIDFIKNYIKDSSNSSFETILELRKGNFVGGGESLAVWRGKGIQGDFILKSTDARRLSLFLKNSDSKFIKFHKNATFFIFKLENGWWFSCATSNPNIKRMANIEDSLKDQQYSGKAIVSKSAILNGIKLLRHTIDDKVTNVAITLSKIADNEECVLSFTNSRGQVSVSRTPCFNIVWNNVLPTEVNLDYKRLQDVLKTFNKDSLELEIYDHLNSLRISEFNDDFSMETILNLRATA